MGDATDGIEDEIVRLARAGDSHGAAALMAKHYKRWLAGFVRRRARPETVDDVCAKVWVVIAKGVPQDLGSPRGWLAGIAFNIVGHALDARQFEVLDSELAQKPMWRQSTTSVRGKLIRAQETEALRRAISALPVDDRQLLHLQFSDGLKPAEIVAATGRDVSPKTLSKQISRIVDGLRDLVKR